jgi:hypothetical protein
MHCACIQKQLLGVSCMGEVITKRAFAKTIVKGYVAALPGVVINVVPVSPKLNSHVQDVYAAET